MISLAIFHRLEGKRVSWTLRQGLGEVTVLAHKTAANFDRSSPITDRLILFSGVSQVRRAPVLGLLRTVHAVRSGDGWLELKAPVRPQQSEGAAPEPVEPPGKGLRRAGSADYRLRERRV